MKKETTKLESPAVLLQHKINQFSQCQSNEIQILYNYLQTNIATASMVTAATGILQKNICRYKRELEKNDMLWEINLRPCKITGCIAAYLTTNRDLMPSASYKQLCLFSESEECNG